MSDQEEGSDAQNVDSSKEREDAFGTTNIPVPSEEVPESDQTEDCESELEPSSGGREKRVEEPSDQSVLSLELNDVKQLMEDVTADEQVSYSPGDSGESLAKSDNAVQSAEQYSKDSLAFLEKIEAVKESLKTSMKDSSATGIT